jgi:hypothetical protein
MSYNCDLDEWNGDPSLPNPFNVDLSKFTKSGWSGKVMTSVWVAGLHKLSSKPTTSPTANDRISPIETELRMVGTSFLDRPYVPNVYKVTATDLSSTYPNLAAGDLLGFVHVETSLIAANDGPYTIGIAYSKTSGETWVYCGDIVRTANNISEGTDNITGIPYLVVGSYFYVYYCDYPKPGWCCASGSASGKRPCVARGYLPSVLGKASNAYAERFNSKTTNVQVEPFYKYIYVNASGSYSRDLTNSLNWDSQIAAPTGTNSAHAGADILPIRLPNMAWIDLHSDAAFCSALNKYLITVSNGPADQTVPGTLALYSSGDGVNWINPVVIDATTASGYYIEKAHSFFVSLNSDAADDSHIVGKQFYIYTPYTYYNSGHVVSQVLCQHKITIIPDQTPVNMLLLD